MLTLVLDAVTIFFNLVIRFLVYCCIQVSRPLFSVSLSVSHCPLQQLNKVAYSQIVEPSLLYRPVTQASVPLSIGLRSYGLFNNNSIVAQSQFSYIIPYNKEQACDIYGPICQTGSRTVGVNLTTATTTTVLPCSSYLSTQSSYLYSFGGASASIGYNSPENITPNWPQKWQVNFGRSPECSAYAAVHYLQSGIYTFSGCGSVTLSSRLPRRAFLDPRKFHLDCFSSSVQG